MKRLLSLSESFYGRLRAESYEWATTEAFGLVLASTKKTRNFRTTKVKEKFITHPRFQGFPTRRNADPNIGAIAEFLLDLQERNLKEGRGINGVFLAHTHLFNFSKLDKDMEVIGTIPDIKDRALKFGFKGLESLSDGDKDKKTGFPHVIKKLKSLGVTDFELMPMVITPWNVAAYDEKLRRFDLCVDEEAIPHGREFGIFELIDWTAQAGTKEEFLGAIKKSWREGGESKVGCFVAEKALGLGINVASWRSR